MQCAVLITASITSLSSGHSFFIASVSRLSWCVCACVYVAFGASWFEMTRRAPVHNPTQSDHFMFFLSRDHKQY
jgi:hypothetical protein